MIKNKEKKLYNINFELFSTGKVLGKLRGEQNGKAKNFIVLMNGDFEKDIWLFSMEEPYVLAELLVNFLGENPEFFRLVLEAMEDAYDEQDVTWN